MKKGQKIFIFLMLFIVVLAFAVSCNKEDTNDYTAIQTPNLKYENGVYMVNVGSNAYSKIDLTSYFTVSENATYEISKTEDFSQKIGSEVELVGGENKFFIKVTDNNGHQKVYQFVFLKTKTCTVDFVIENSTDTVPSVQCNAGDKITAPSYTKNGYTVTWDFDFSTAINDDITIKGTIAPNNYKITVSAPGTADDGKVVNVVYGETPVFTVPAKTGYDFVKWTCNGKDFNPSSAFEFTSDVTVEAVYEIHKYTISYNLIGGNNNSLNPVEFYVNTETFELLAATWSNDDYVFAGWYTDANYTNKITAIEKGTAKNLELYAKWDEVEFSTELTISAPGLDFDGEVIVVKYGQAYDLTDFTRAGYTLSNWTTEDGATVPSIGTWNNKTAAITIKPVWNAIKYTITYNNLNGATNNNPLTFTCEDEINLADLTWIDNTYTFLGWYYDADLTQPFENLPAGRTENLVVYAKCEVVVQEKITNVAISAPGFDCDGQVIPLKHGENYQLPVLSKNGYAFLGWKTEDDALTFEASGLWADESEELTLVPNFNIESYLVEYVLNGGENNTNNPNSYTINDSVSLLEPTWSDGTYVFAGWYVDQGFETEFESFEPGKTGNIKVYAKWIKITNVTILAPNFDIDGEELEFVFGENYTMPTVSKEGYLLDGWKNEDGSIIIPSSGKWTREEKEITLSPNWKPQSYSITYILNGGTNNELNVNTSYTIEDVIALYAPSKQYANFAGWYTDADFTDKIENISNRTGNLVLYASWDYVSYKVTYNANGGTVEKPDQDVIWGADYTLMIPVKNGYKFDGWYDGDTLVSTEGVWLTESGANLAARWSVIKYTIEYEMNGGTQSGTGWKTEYTIEDGNYTLPLPRKDGKIFLGWSYEGGIVQTSITIKKGTTGNLKFIANWCDEKDDKGIMYNINSDGTATVIGYSGPIGDITIPSEHDGHKVTAIASNAFNGYGEKIAGMSSSTSFVKMVIPTTITSIGENAFANCDDLKVQLSGNPSASKIEQWESNLTIASGNDHVVDVIKNLRPAIGWNIYVKP